MREIPILFSGPMVLAILEDRKTQTRRTRGLDKFNASEWRDSPGEWRLEGDLWRFFPEGSGEAVHSCKCPYGVAGDILWVKESWHLCPEENPIRTTIVYRADSPDGVACPNCGKKIKWKSSLFMPRFASRLSLENLGSRPERLQSITVLDVAREGVLQSGPIKGDEFQKVWNSINPHYPWESNPTVWRIEFRRMENGG